MPVDEMIIASINCLDEIEERFKTQMIAWVRSAADFGEINDKLVKENAELKADNDARKFAMAMSEKVEKQLREENAELQEKLNTRSCQNCKNNNKSCPNDGSCVHYSKWEDYKNSQLTKAKNIIRDLYFIIQGRIDYEDNIQIKDSMDLAKVFLNEVEE